MGDEIGERRTGAGWGRGGPRSQEHELERVQRESSRGPRPTRSVPSGTSTREVTTCTEGIDRATPKERTSEEADDVLRGREQLGPSRRGHSSGRGSAQCAAAGAPAAHCRRPRWAVRPRRAGSGLPSPAGAGRLPRAPELPGLGDVTRLPPRPWRSDRRAAASEVRPPLRGDARGLRMAGGSCRGRWCAG
eukprot:scaffold7985_cov50-Phaeocystis_antarctica.AAC.1